MLHTIDNSFCLYRSVNFESKFSFLTKNKKTKNERNYFLISALGILDRSNQKISVSIMLNTPKLIKKKYLTTDAMLGNCLHCMAENQLPLPNF